MPKSCYIPDLWPVRGASEFNKSCIGPLATSEGQSFFFFIPRGYLIKSMSAYLPESLLTTVLLHRVSKLGQL